MGTFIRTWRADWAGLSRAQVANANTHSTAIHATKGQGENIEIESTAPAITASA